MPADPRELDALAEVADALRLDLSREALAALVDLCDCGVEPTAVVEVLSETLARRDGHGQGESDAQTDRLVASAGGDATDADAIADACDGAERRMHSKKSRRFGRGTEAVLL